MAKKKTRRKSEMALPVSWDNIYCLTLKNTGPFDGPEGMSFAVLMNLVEAEIDRIDRGESDDTHLKTLLVIKGKLDLEFDKGRDC